MAAASSRVPIPKNGVDYRGCVVLAPMVRSGELPSRLMALRYGADLVWGPETVDRAMIGTNVRKNERTSTIEFTRLPSNKVKDGAVGEDTKESVIYRIHPSRESSRLIYQIGTASPDLAVKAADVVGPYVSGIDVNAGCPKPFSTSGGMGAALLSAPDLLCSILSKLVKEIGEKYEIGVSVKIRILKTEEETKALVEQLCKTGITGLTVHCRTRNMRKHERAVRHQLRMIADTCRAAGVACLMNGDVQNRDEAEKLIVDYGADGAMMAEAAEKNPSVFRAASESGVAPWRTVVREYLGDAMGVENKWGNTKFLVDQLMPGKEQGKRNLSQAKNYEHLCEILDFPELCEKARAVDQILGTSRNETRSEQKANNDSRKHQETIAIPTKDLNKHVKRQRTEVGVPEHNGDHQAQPLGELHNDTLAPRLQV
ncbi:MAG: hypothetical protein M1831_000367 [Alyxoria varia]|nr:MAG: hypothetical protein M1831_000367 [Alyxoria varia]